MKKIRTLILVTLALVAGACSGGDDDGGSDSNTTDLDDRNTTAKIDSSYEYQLPVVFHVLYQDASDPSQYVAYSRIVEILNNVNELYKGGVYDREGDRSHDMGLAFVLATEDEDGNTLEHPGVVYTRYDGDYPIDPYSFMDDNTGKNVKYIWDPNTYINVMLYNFAQTDDDGSTTLGISHMPYVTQSDTALAGLAQVTQTTLTKRNLRYAHCSSINSLYVLRDYESTRYSYYGNTDSYTYRSTDISTTLAHELGHYLGLHHVFTERSADGATEVADSCGDTDYCDDTPSYNYKEYQSYVSELAGQAAQQGGQSLSMSDLDWRSDCDGGRFTSTNLMDYSISLSYQFTRDQWKRVRRVLYYSPLIPGPKLNGANAGTRGAADGPLDLPKRIAR